MDAPDTLWSDNLLGSGGAMSGLDGAGLAAGTVLAPVSDRPKFDRNIKILIGVGAAVPVLVLFAIVISILIRPEPPTRSVADSNPAVEHSAPNPEPEQASIPSTSSPGFPPAYQDSFPSAESAQNTLPTAEDAGAIGFEVGVRIGVWAVYVLIATAILQTACGLCHVTPPSFGKAVLVSIAAGIVASLIGALASVIPHNEPGEAAFVFVIILVSVVTGVGFTYSKLLPTTFGKGVLIYIAQAIIILAIAFVLILILLMFAFLIGALAAMRS